MGVQDFFASIPEGTEVVGDYHTHADYSVEDPVTRKPVRTSDPSKDGYNSDNFSSQDYVGIESDSKGIKGYKGYLGTPSGVFKTYDPATKVISTLYDKTNFRHFNIICILYGCLRNGYKE